MTGEGSAMSGRGREAMTRGGARESRKPAGRRILAALLALATVWLWMLSACGGEDRGGAGEPARAAVPVKVAQAARKSVPIEARAVGNAVPVSTVRVKARVGGELLRAAFREGSEVRQGDLLFTIDPRPYEAAVKEAEARLAQARALAAKAEADVARYEGLAGKEFVTKELYESVRATATSLRATVDADEAVLENARLQLGYCTIRAPISGRTGDLLVHPGNLVKANDDTPLVVIHQVRPIEVRFSVRSAGRTRASSSRG